MFLAVELAAPALITLGAVVVSRDFDGATMLLAVGALVLLQLVQVPMAWYLARRVRRNEQERAELLHRALSASDRERSRIAADLHDGVVQDLAGVGYAIGALSRAAPDEQRPMLDSLGRIVRGAVDSLRKLMVDIYPPDLSGPGLASALPDLGEPLRAAGVDVRMQVEPLPRLSPEVAATLYRTAREVLSNAREHARAQSVSVWLGPDGITPAGDPGVLLQVQDDGVGLPREGVDRRADGHLGLRLLADGAARLGGELVIGPRPGGGTTATMHLPAGQRVG
ncbi:MAG: sensor histidine kinase, partial [Pseudonocardiaceae bacterium]